MPVRRYALQAGDLERLEVSWRPGGTAFVVRFAGQTIAELPGSLPPGGARVSLPDGSLLELSLYPGTPAGTQVELRHDGRALPDERRIRDTAWIVFALGALPALLLAVATVEVSAHRSLLFGLGAGTLATSAGLAALTRRHVNFAVPCVVLLSLADWLALWWLGPEGALGFTLKGLAACGPLFLTDRLRAGMRAIQYKDEWTLARDTADPEAITEEPQGAHLHGEE